jgi:hypothetical protein
MTKSEIKRCAGGHGGRRCGRGCAVGFLPPLLFCFFFGQAKKKRRKNKYVNRLPLFFSRSVVIFFYIIGKFFSLIIGCENRKN